MNQRYGFIRKEHRSSGSTVKSSSSGRHTQFSEELLNSLTTAQNQNSTSPVSASPARGTVTTSPKQPTALGSRTCVAIPEILSELA
ncbi:unnamed protein product, partial [Amoebophrya sp. A25]